jgi:hypothetical protein
VSSAFLVFAILLNAGFAIVVFWWLAREYRRTRAARKNDERA